MAIIRAQVILKTADAIPENFVSNSWCFRLDASAGSGAVLTPILKAFYDSLVSYYSPVITQNGHEIKYSLLPGVMPNYPYDTDVFNLGAAPAGGKLPDELAVVLSFQGLKAAGAPQARRRGRLYIGPLDTAAATDNRPATAFLTAMGNAATTLKAAVTAVGGTAAWCIWSVADQAEVVIDNGWIDNAFDVQRRRGVLPTSRTTFI